MKILTPINKLEMLEALADAGAGEFYMGFYDREWKQRFGEYSDLNRLTLFKETANRYVLEDVEAFVKKAHEKKTDLYITLNAPGYESVQKERIRFYLEKLSAYGVDGVITSVPEFIPMIRSLGMKPVASTMCGIQNRDLARWYQKLGMERIILPREVSVEEIRMITEAVPDMEYEVFFMRNGCRYADSNCMGLHGGEKGALCYSLRHGIAEYHTAPGEGYLKDMLRDTHEKFSTVFHEYACGQCALYQFLKLGIAALKIVGRLDDSEEILRDVTLTAKNLEIARDCSSEKEYLERMILPGDPEDYCRGGMSCYYPEIRW